jgi:hypothetical protein
VSEEQGTVSGLIATDALQRGALFHAFEIGRQAWYLAQRIAFEYAAGQSPDHREMDRGGDVRGSESVT